MQKNDEVIWEPAAAKTLVVCGKSKKLLMSLFDFKHETNKKAVIKWKIMRFKLMQKSEK